MVARSQLYLYHRRRVEKGMPTKCLLLPMIERLQSKPVHQPLRHLAVHPVHRPRLEQSWWYDGRRVSLRQRMRRWTTCKSCDMFDSWELALIPMLGEAQYNAIAKNETGPATTTSA
jgi:hypothetical protein